jgi:hypothetical protein
MKLAYTRGVSASAKALAFFVAAALGACSAETGDQPEDFVGDEVADDGVPGDVTDKAGDSYVQWCDQPASVGPYGTICIQQGCSGFNCFLREPQAIAECRDEVRRLCGSGVQRWFIVRLWDNTWWHLE